MRILLVEDDESIREVLKLILETDAPVPDLTIDTAENGTEAIKRVTESRPDLVLLDLTLPEEHGFEVFKKLRQLDGCADLPVIAVTAHSLKSLEKESMELGFAGYVYKPIDFDHALFPLIRKILLKEEPRSPVRQPRVA